jgi:hypothetical protein
MSDREREQRGAAPGTPGLVPRFASPRCGGSDLPVRRAPANEPFAEAYSLCARRASVKERYSGGYMYSPTPAQHRQVCAVIRHAGGAV